MTEIQEKYDLGNDKQEDYNKFTEKKLCNCQWDLYDPCTCDFNPSNFGSVYDGSFNGIIYKSFCAKFTYKQSNNDWVICETSNTPAKNIPRFRGKIKNNEFAKDLFESFEVKE